MELVKSDFKCIRCKGETGDWTPGWSWCANCKIYIHRASGTVKDTQRQKTYFCFMCGQRMEGKLRECPACGVQNPWEEDDG